MNTPSKFVATSLAVLLTAVAAHGQSRGRDQSCGDGRISRPVTQIYSLETGSLDALSTYLSPLRYSGFRAALSGQWHKTLPWGRNTWRMRFDADISGALTANPAGTASMLDFGASFGWGAARMFRLPHGVTLAAGAYLSADAGVLYMPRNSNNPAAARGAISLGLRASASWRLHIGRLPVLLGDCVSVPSLSAFFSPAYGETYYEIYLGNRSGLIHCGWWGNRFYIDNLLSADLDIGPSALRLGYRFGVNSSYICHINTQLVSHSFVIGWIPHGIGLRPRPARATTVINALY